MGWLKPLPGRQVCHFLAIWFHSMFAGSIDEDYSVYHSIVNLVACERLCRYKDVQ